MQEMYAKAFISKVVFNNGKSVSVDNDDIIIFVGANNVGKSQALKDIYSKSSSSSESSVIVSDVEIRKEGGKLSTLLNSISVPKEAASTPYIYYSVLGKNMMLAPNGDEVFLKDKKLKTYVGLFLANINTGNRLGICKTTENIPPDAPRSHPIHYSVFDSECRIWLSENFKKAFGVGVVPDENYGPSVTLRMTEPIKLDDGKFSDEQGRHEAYARLLRQCPKVEDQGDGIKSFTGILLYLMLDYFCSYLIDEPESFLHPPQARIMGQIVGKSLVGRQAFISTHSKEFIRGLLEVASHRVKIIRITRPSAASNEFSVLDNSKVVDLWKDSLLKHSDIMSGIFYKNVVICESDSDCKLYSIIYDSLKEEENRFSESLFVHCGGKSRMSKVVRALRSLNIDFRVVPDIDILNDVNVIKGLVEACGGDWSEIQRDYNILLSAIMPDPNFTGREFLERADKIVAEKKGVPLLKSDLDCLKKLCIPKGRWSSVKAMGIAGIPPGDAFNAFSRLKTVLEKFSIFLVPCGEIEGFVRAVGGHGPEWVNTVLENYPTLKESVYADLKDFVKHLNL